MIARTLPCDLASERALIGSVLLRPDVLDSVEVSAADFLTPAHERIWTAVQSIAARGALPVPEAVAAELEARGETATTGGAAYLAELLGDVITAGNAAHYAGRVRETARLRALIGACSEVADSAYAHRGDVAEFVAEAEARIFAATAGTATTGRPLRDVIRDALAVITERVANRGRVGVTTGLPDLDGYLGGWQASDLILLAARTSQGKTAIAVNFASVAAENGHPVAVFSLEQSDVQLAERWLVQSGAAPSTAVSRGPLDARDWERITATASRAGALPVWIDDTPALSVAHVRSRARRFVSRYKGGRIPLVILDYLQLCHGRGDTREQEVSAVSRELKALAKELRCPVIALAQLRRSADDRDGAPRLSDLRESGALEQDADVVCFLWRPSQDRSDVRLTIAKQRNGPTGEVTLTWIPERLRFEPGAREWQEDPRTP